MASQAGKKSGKRKEAQARRETQAAAEVRRSAALGRAAAEGLGGERCRRETRAAAPLRVRIRALRSVRLTASSACARAQEDGEALAERVAALAGDNQTDAVDACCCVADEGFRRGAHELAFAVIRASLHKHGLENDKLCRRYFFLLDTVVKARMSAKKKEPPKMLYLREMLGRVPEVLSGQLALLGGVDGVKAGERCVLMKERGVMVIGLSLLEWRLLLEKQAGPQKWRCR